MPDVIVPQLLPLCICHPCEVIVEPLELTVVVGKEIAEPSQTAPGAVAPVIVGLLFTVTVCVTVLAQWLVLVGVNV